MKRNLLICIAVLLAVLTGAAAQAKLPEKLRGDEFTDSQFAVARTLSSDRKQLHPGDEFTLAVQLIPFHRGDLKFHVYSDAPSADGSYIESTLTVVDPAKPQKLVAAPGTPLAPVGDNAEVEWDKPVFPPGVEHGTAVKQLWLEGQPTITIHGKLKPDAKIGPKTFYAVTTFMSCTEDFCLSPSEVLLKWDLEAVAPGAPTDKPLTLAELSAPQPFSEDMYSLPPDAAASGDSGAVLAAAGKTPAAEGSSPSASASAASAPPAKSNLPAKLRGDEFSESQYAAIRALYSDRTQLKPGDDFTLAVQFIPFHREVEENGGSSAAPPTSPADASSEDTAPKAVKFHLYSNVPSPTGAYAESKLQLVNAEKPQQLVLTSQPAPAADNGDVEWDEPHWPTGVQHSDQLWLEGQPVITIHGKLRPTAKPGKKTFNAIATFMTCTEDFCLAPSELVLSWNLDVVGPDQSPSIARLTDTELNAPIAYSEALFALPGDVPVAKPQLPMKTSLTTTPSTAKDGGSASGGATQWPLWKLLLFSFLGGLILNFMPCVLPVVSIKVISLVRQVEDHPQDVLAHGVMFSLGIIVMFLVAAIVIAVIQAGGTKLGWGAQFQSPIFNAAMAALIFAFGLSLAGVYTIKPPSALTVAGEHLAEREGLSGSFFKGVLATVLGTPCVGPFLGPALGVAFQRTWFDTIWIFFVVGIGMAVPYLAMLPFIMHMGRRERGTLSRKLQESKHWLVDFERVMAFLMFATVVYLLNILLGVTDGSALIWTLGFLVIVGFAAWLWGRMTSAGPRLVPAAVLSVLVVVVAGAVLTLGRVDAFLMDLGITPKVIPGVMKTSGSSNPNDPSQPHPVPNHPNWEVYDQPRLDYLTSHGQAVLVDFTAEWCPNCKYNERTALEIPETRSLRDELNMVFMKADWTRKGNPDIVGDKLRTLGYSSIPLSVIYAPVANPQDDRVPIKLDGVFGKAELHAKMKQAVGK